MSSTRKRLIDLLSKHEDQYISGQQLSEELSISRSAVWKQMNRLKQDGYEVEAVENKGYRIIDSPAKVSENTITWGLDTAWLGHRIIHKTTIPSTQRLAHEYALDGSPHGTVIIADEQTEGKGRISRAWHSKKGTGMWMSLILRPAILPYLAPQLTLLTATVLAEVLDGLTNVHPQIKWPNDILVQGKKTTGILTEMQAEQDQIVYVIIGVGMNVNQQIEDFPEDIKEKATSLRAETGEKVELNDLIQRFLELFEKRYTTYLHEGFDRVKSSWETYGFRLKETLQIANGNETWEGVFLGIAEDGALLAERADGSIEKVYSGEISWFS
ncbi:MAG TPA: biotin--[acetyl-CoA-carboxylase] ligase [Pseudogracilibacillus sp.]|nr:biotin--[acetyl-CoA-carboxylase] ligase [Pseudogracilibacillus sp.]